MPKRCFIVKYRFENECFAGSIKSKMKARFFTFKKSLCFEKNASLNK